MPWSKSHASVTEQKLLVKRRDLITKAPTNDSRSRLMVTSGTTNGTRANWPASSNSSEPAEAANVCANRIPCIPAPSRKQARESMSCKECESCSPSATHAIASSYGKSRWLGSRQWGVPARSHGPQQSTANADASLSIDSQLTGPSRALLSRLLESALGKRTGRPPKDHRAKPSARALVCL